MKEKGQIDIYKFINNENGNKELFNYIRIGFSRNPYAKLLLLYFLYLGFEICVYTNKL